METYKDLLGIKFKLHGRTKEEGMDCYGVCIEVLRRNGINLKDCMETPDKAYEEVYSSTQDYKQLDHPENLCMIIFKNAEGLCYHCGIYLGNGLVIHSRHRVGVAIEPLSKFPCSEKEYYRVY